MVITPYGNEYEMDVLVNYMDDDIREELHAQIAPCSAQEFADVYADLHEDKFGEEWEPYKESPQI